MVQVVATPEFLMKGGWYALEQAGRLIVDAEKLLDSGSCSGAAGMALLSREEMAKSRKLFRLWIRAACRGDQVTLSDVVRELNMHHVEKQREAQTMFSVPVDQRTLEILRREREVAPDEYDALLREMRATTDRMIAELPKTRHHQRRQASCVDPAKDGEEWLRPVNMTREEAEEAIIEASDD